MLIASATFASDLLPALVVALLISGAVAASTAWLGKRGKPDRCTADGEPIGEVPARGRWEVHPEFREV